MKDLDMIFNGVMSTPMTPFGSDEKISPGLIDEYFSWSSENGVSGVFLLGTWGGFTLLSPSERIKISESFGFYANKYNIKSILHIGSNNIHEAENLAKSGSDIGVTALASTIPYYHSSAGYYKFDHYRAHFNRLRSFSNLPFFVYNNARTTGVLLTPEEFSILVEDGINGVKDGSKDLGWLLSAQEMLHRKNLKAEIIPGNTSALVYSFMYGTRSATSGAAVVFPKLLADIFRQLQEKNLDRAIELHKVIMRSRGCISKYGNPAMVSYSLLHKMNVPNLGSPKPPWKRIENKRLDNLVAELKEIDYLGNYLLL